MKSLQQYLEFLKLSGIQDIFFEEVSEIHKKDKQSEDSSCNDLEELKIRYSKCKKCALAESRTKFVYGNGNPKAKLMLIGEGPGAEEDKTGKVFVGRAGQLLTKMLKAINLNRSEVYITNVVKCRPPGNRNPKPDEIAACLPYLNEQIELIQPKLILLLGRVAAVTLFGQNKSLRSYRESDLTYKKIKTYVTYHPSALLRNPHWKRPAWEDLQKLQKKYESINE
ncbi:MAG: uracil-DNA glycosylase [Candidatus Cloacimonadota bacterium]|nr:uracil-DNA glycosylase [Candidatus Cloacimonadota bacterium]